MKHVVFLTGAGMSAESGINTFRDNGGLWEQYNVMDVASVDGWHKNPSLVQKFYNERRKQLKKTEANEGHKLIAELEKKFKVTVITQNVDNLHERAGSSHVVHLHGELTKACNESKTEVIDIGYRDIEADERAKDGSRLRPFIVWFGEAVPLIEKAVHLVMNADIVVIIGTSMQVYPAAALINYAKKDARLFLIDPNDVEMYLPRVEIIKEKASVGMRILKEKLFFGS
ncbi:MAG: NAD-dependent deacylase [Campylobacteraceae bacterium]|jgi:NAD-dependent deacetylase|nr:NAD-dependent deacylase [Campylobacteraceae bacterium]